MRTVLWGAFVVAALTALAFPATLRGPGIAGGQRGGAATPADIAPTLGTLAGVPFPTADGRMLVEPGRK